MIGRVAPLMRPPKPVTTFTDTENPFVVLGVAKDATMAQIDSAWRQLCLTCHPDKRAGKSKEESDAMEKQYFRIQTAHDIL